MFIGCFDLKNLQAFAGVYTAHVRANLNNRCKVVDNVSAVWNVVCLF